VWPLISEGYNGLAFAINNHDEVVEAAENNIPDPFSYIGFYFAFVNQSRAFRWKNGALQDLGTSGEGNDASASFVNERGQIGGFSYTDSTPNPNNGFLCPPNVPTQHPFLWENGKMLDLGTLGGVCAAPAATPARRRARGATIPGRRARELPP
jgi:probable HAF family extracellular repeat protein